jgi:hypothetical protein
MTKIRVFLALMVVFCLQFAVAFPVQAATCWGATSNAELTNFDFTGCNLTDARFLGTNDLSGANFTNANLTGAHLSGKDLTGANLTGANLTGADVRNVNFTNANLTRANLSSAVLMFMNTDNPPTVRFAPRLAGANLTDANFYRSQLVGANLSNANLTRTNFEGANLSKAQGTGIIGKPKVIWPLYKIENGVFREIAYLPATISGTATPGKPLKAIPSNNFEQTTVLTYQWFRYLEAIPKATKSSYVITPDDCDTEIKVRIAGTVQSFLVIDKFPVKAIPRCQMKPTTPKLSGIPKSKQTIKATVSTWIKGASVTYQWLLDGFPIEGATTSKFTILPSHKKHKISLAVTQSRMGYETATATSTALKIL